VFLQTLHLREPGPNLQGWALWLGWTIVVRGELVVFCPEVFIHADAIDVIADNFGVSAEMREMR